MFGIFSPTIHWCEGKVVVNREADQNQRALNDITTTSCNCEFVQDNDIGWLQVKRRGCITIRVFTRE